MRQVSQQRSSIIGICGLLLLGSGSARAQEPGALEIRSGPDVEVVWEGVALGTTDEEGLLSIQQIPPGRYEVSLTKPGFAGRTVEVEVREAEISRVQLSLRPLKPPQRRSEPRQVTEPAAGAESRGSTSRSDPMAGEVERPAETEPLTGGLEEVPAAKPVGHETGDPGEERPAAVPPPIDVIGSEEGGRGSSTVGWVAVLLAALTLGWVILATRKKRAAVSGRRSVTHEDRSVPPLLEEEKPVSPGADEEVFLEDLKRREEVLLDSGGEHRRRRRPEVIEAEVVSVRDTEEEL